MISLSAIERTLYWPVGCPQPPDDVEDHVQFARKWVKENPGAGHLQTSSRATYVGVGLSVLGMVTGLTGFFKENKWLQNCGWCLGVVGLFATFVGKMCGYEFDLSKTIKNTVVAGGTNGIQKTPEEVGIDADKVEKVDITSHDQKLDGYLIKAKNDTKKTLIYFHSVRNNIGHCLEEVKKIQENLDANILIVDPRGFGNSSLGDEELTPEGMVDDAKAIYDFAASRYGSENISVFGHSLGGAIAVQLAQEREIDTLLLESTFTKSEDAVSSFGNGSMPQFVKNFVKKYIEDMKKFNSIDSINNVKANNVIVVHGTADNAIPSQQGKDLFDKLDGNKYEKKHIELPGANHANYIDYYETEGVYAALNSFIFASSTNTSQQSKTSSGKGKKQKPVTAGA